MKKKFLELCRNSDFLLKKYQNNPYISLISSLHIIREHPIDLMRYKFVFNKQISSIVLNFIKLIQVYIVGILKNLFKKKYSYIHIRNNNHRHYSNIFVSHFISLKQCANKEDFYFKNMPIISSKNTNTLVVLINQTKIDLSYHFKKFTKRNYDIVILSDNLEYKDKITIFIKTFRAFFIILFDILFNLRSFKQIIMLNALSNIFSDSTQLSYRFTNQIKMILLKYKPNNIFFTYEGYSWEKALCIAVREYSNSAKSIGYQHSRLFKYQHSIKRTLNNKLDPHIILTSGQFAYKEFKKKLPSLSIVNIGKTLSHNKNNISLNKLKYFNIKSKIYICVLPEGSVEESFKLLKFSLSCALKFQNIFFIWRFHPLTNFNQLNKRINFKDNLPQNIIVSKNNLDEDLKNSHMALYRGSTSILEAMRLGIIPIYLKIKDEFDIDILGKTGKNYEWNIKSETIVNFYRQINKITKSKEKLLRLQKNVIIFSKNYFTHFNEKKFNKLFCK